MAGDFHLTVSGLSESERALSRLALLLLDLRPFWPKVVPLFIGWEREQFATQGAFWGTPWAPLTPAYAARKSLLHPGKGLLIADGDLRRGASTPLRDAGPRHLTLTIQWLKDEGKLDPGWHQFGTTKMVARPLLGDTLPPPADAELTAAIEEYADEIIATVGL